MERCIYDGELVSHLVDNVLVDDLLLELNHVLVVDLFAKRNIEAGSDGIFLGHCLNIVIISDGYYFVDDSCVVRRCNLCAVLPVNLVAVVFRRIV